MQNRIDPQEPSKSSLSVLLGAAFLMATSAIGPGFLTQTAVFTEKYGASFGFIILLSIIVDIGAQINVWRIIGVSGMRGQDVANAVFPGLGYVVAGLVAFGGLAFNIGNIAGASMGMNVMFGIDMKMAALLSATIGILLFISKEMGKAMDAFSKILGGLMILVVLYVAVATNPPIGEAMTRTIFPEKFSFLALITIIGGTVGGYITFAGGHRLIDGGVTGEAAVDEITKGSVMGIGIASIMRILLFLAVLGVVAKGVQLDPANPPASAFKLGAGLIGYRFFGVVLWAASITSVVGAAYTSISFLRSLFPPVEKYNRLCIIGFIMISTIVFVTIGKPVNLLILAGALNGLILPITLGTMLLASKNSKIIGEYKHPRWLIIMGILIVILESYGGYQALLGIKALF